MRGIAALVLAVATAGCIRTTSVTCEGGHVCAPDKACDDVNNTCVYPDQLTSCVGVADGEPCNINGVAGGICKGMICIPAACGDELVTGDELCDGESDIPDVGTCVDFAYDHGPLSCSTLCTESFTRCRRLGWQQRSLPGMGQISGIWEDGEDLWVSNQNGIYRRISGVWQPLEKPAPTNVWYRTIWAGGGHAFAGGMDGSIAHWDGTAWQNTTAEVPGPVLGIWGRSPTDVYAVGGTDTTGKILHYDGTTWSSMGVRVGIPRLNAVWGAGTEVYAVGMAGTILRLQGNGWMEMLSSTSHDLFGVWGPSPTKVLVVGNPPSIGVGGDAVILSLQGTTWGSMTIPGNTGTLNAISGRSTTEIYAVGARAGSNILYFDGSTWTPMVSNIVGSALGLNAVHAGASGVYAAKRPSLFLEYTDAGHLEVDARSVPLRSVWAAGPDFAIAVGDDGSWQQYAQGTWTSVGYPACWGANPPPPPATIPNFVHAVWGADKGDVWIVGPYGKMMHYTGGSTTCVDLPSGKWLYDVWGSGGSDVFAVGADGADTDPHLVHYDGQTWTDWSDRLRPFGMSARGVWGSGPNNVLVTVDTKVVRYDGSTWSDTGLVSPHKLKAIWGTSPTDIFAVGAQGAIFHYDGSAWSQMFVPLGTTIPTNEEWTDVHGLGSDDVYVVGSRTLMHYDGASWAPVRRLVASGAEGVFAVPGSVFVVGEAGVDPHLIGRLQ